MAGNPIELGESFKGLIHSLEITTSTGPLAIDKAAINGTKEENSFLVCNAACDGSFCIDSTINGCLLCGSGKFLKETFPGTKMGTCQGIYLLNIFNLIPSPRY